MTSQLSIINEEKISSPFISALVVTLVDELRSTTYHIHVVNLLVLAMSRSRTVRREEHEQTERFD